MIKRIGFACKWKNHLHDAFTKEEKEAERAVNTSSTTVAWLNRQTSDDAETKLFEVAEHNLTSVQNVLLNVAKLDPRLRMMRLSSDLIPMYTEPKYKYLWNQSDIQDWYTKEFAKIGNFARTNNIRLSFHPGQFCCIVSDKPDVVVRSVDELEYHAKMATMMGYARSRLDFKINVHLSGKGGVDAFEAAYHLMSPELRSCLTLENDEYQASIDTILKLKHRVGVVLDIHHNYIMTGEYFSINDDRIKMIEDSWQGRRPTIHYSQSRDEYLSKYHNQLPTLNDLLQDTNRSKLRAHSDMYNHQKINEWALEHNEWADIISEAKFKNLAAVQLFEQSINA